LKQKKENNKNTLDNSCEYVKIETKNDSNKNTLNNSCEYVKVETKNDSSKFIHKDFEFFKVENRCNLN
jgi:hypothetical protein